MCFDGNPLYDTTIKSPAYSSSFGTTETRFDFAREAIKQLRIACPEALVSGLVRVDIMVDDDGRMLVNEFESLEAGHQHNTHSSVSHASFVASMMDYYYDMLLAFAKEVLELGAQNV